VLESQDNRWAIRAWVKNIEDDVHITASSLNCLHYGGKPASWLVPANFRYRPGAQIPPYAGLAPVAGLN
jgi:hypothetical protein